ncbi:MAG: hypothetical protein JJ895_05445 [Balneolaceae bacterium]|nr:hypothetical protein [Balneolaceae bacterium]
MILKESEIEQDNIIPVLGNPYKEPGKWLTVTGSSYYFIKELTTSDGEEVLIWEDSKGIFQRYDDGLALLVNRSNYQRAVLMRSDSFRSINVFVDDTGLQRETVLEIETTEYKGRFITSYSSFKSQAKFFRKLDLVEV